MIQLVAFHELGEDTLHRESVRVQNGEGGPNRLRVVRVARSGHGKAARLRVFEGVTIVAPQGGRGVENFQGVNRQRLENRKTNAGAEEIVRMRGNGEPAAFVNDFANFAGRLPFQIRQRDTEAKQVAFRGRDFDAGDDEKIVHRQTVLAHEPLLQKVRHGVASVVVCNGEAMQAFLPRGRDIFLRARHAIAGKERVRVQVDVEGHRPEASLERAKWKASVSRNGPSSAKR